MTRRRRHQCYQFCGRQLKLLCGDLPDTVGFHTSLTHPGTHPRLHPVFGLSRQTLGALLYYNRYQSRYVRDSTVPGHIWIFRPVRSGPATWRKLGSSYTYVEYTYGIKSCTNMPRWTNYYISMMMRKNVAGGPIWPIATMVGYYRIMGAFCDVSTYGRRGRLYEVYTAIFLKVLFDI